MRKFIVEIDTELDEDLAELIYDGIKFQTEEVHGVDSKVVITREDGTTYPPPPREPTEEEVAIRNQLRQQAAEKVAELRKRIGAN